MLVKQCPPRAAGEDGPLVPIQAHSRRFVAFVRMSLLYC